MSRAPMQYAKNLDSVGSGSVEDNVLAESRDSPARFPRIPPRRLYIILRDLSFFALEQRARPRR